MIKNMVLRWEFSEMVLALAREYGADREDLAELVAELPARPPGKRGPKKGRRRHDDPAVIGRIVQRVTEDGLKMHAAAQEAAAEMGPDPLVTRAGTVARLTKQANEKLKRRRVRARPVERWARAREALASVTDEGDPV